MATGTAAASASWSILTSAVSLSSFLCVTVCDCSWFISPPPPVATAVLSVLALAEASAVFFLDHASALADDESSPSSLTDALTSLSIAAFCSWLFLFSWSAPWSISTSASFSASASAVWLIVSSSLMVSAGSSSSSSPVRLSTKSNAPDAMSPAPGSA